jgi:hypothetical protein
MRFGYEKAVSSAPLLPKPLVPEIEVGFGVGGLCAGRTINADEIEIRERAYTRSFHCRDQFGQFAWCLGDHTAESTLTGGGDKFFYSATVSSKSNKACVKVVTA